MPKSSLVPPHYCADGHDPIRHGGEECPLCASLANCRDLHGRLMESAKWRGKTVARCDNVRDGIIALLGGLP